ncbi:Beta-barrel assembly machine subunit BamA [alpha proteobacterium HIMB5]|nr:Beta-barrel assembly machine subunit BamA [alpha proteobacterium HIMB5]
MKKLFTLVLFLILYSFQVKSIEINKVEIKNNDRISKETIITYGDIELGKNYTESDLNNIIKNLYNTNFFNTINFTINNDILIINVEENKLIQSVIIKGVKSNRIKESVLENLYSKDKAPFLIDKVKQDLTRIKTSLNYIGYYLAEVNSKTIDNDNNTVDLVFEINLGDKSKISKIEFVGDKKIKDRILRNIIISEESKFWKFITNKKYVNENTIKRDKRLLKNYYLNEGYFDVKIESASVKFKDDKTFKLKFKIDAGEKFYVNSVKLNLPLDYNKENFLAVQNSLDKMVNEFYSLNKITKTINEIDKISLSRQYDFINADLQEIVVDKNKIDLIINIKESEKFYVERINVFGNNITFENVIRSKLEIDEGDPYNELLSAKSMNNLRASGLFKEVNSEIREGSEFNTKILDITVEEKPTGEISVGAGAGSDGGTVGFSVSENNFLGKGIKLGSSLRITDDSITGKFSVNNPNFNYTNKSLSTVFESTVIDKMTENGYETHKTGFSFGSGFEQFENIYFTPTISNYYEDLTTSSKASSNLKKQSGSYLESKFSYSLDYDMRNQRYQTFDGFRSTFRQTLPLYSDEYSFSNSYDFKKWHRFSNNMVTSINFFGKHVNSITNDDVRITNRFYLPRNKLKGFKSRQIGPKDGKDYVGGNYAAAVNFDTTIPGILDTLENIDVKYFIDAANLWGIDYSDTVDDSNEVRASTGLTVDWFTPIGPLNFSLAQDLNKANSDKTERFQFNLGTTF